MMKLGGNIVLDGCDNLEPATLVVLKKMVGNYARKISEKASFDELKISLSNQEKGYKLDVTLKMKDAEIAKSGENLNLFFALDNALKGFL